MKKIHVFLVAMLTLTMVGCKEHMISEESLPQPAIDFAYEVINDTVYNLDYYEGCEVRIYPTVSLATPCDWEINDGRTFKDLDELIVKFPEAGEYMITAYANNGKIIKPIQIAAIRPIVTLIQTDSICTVDSSYIAFDVELPNPQKLEAVYKWTFPAVKDEAGQVLTDYDGVNPGKVMFTKSGSQPVKLQVFLGGKQLDVVTKNVQVALKDPAPTLYYAVKNGNIMARKLTESTNAEKYDMGVSSGQHPFNLVFADNTLFILNPGKQFNYVNDENGVMGDGSITAMAADASAISTMISNVGGPAFQDPFYGYVDGDKLYYSDRNTGIFSIPLNTRNQVWSLANYPYFVQNAQLGYYGKGLAYGAITGGLCKVEGTWYWSKTFNGQGIWRFVDADILPDASSYDKAAKPAAGEILTAFYIKAMAYDAKNKLFYFTTYDLANGIYCFTYDQLQDAALMKGLGSASDLKSYQLTGSVELLPIVESGKDEGSSGEYAGICQLAIDEATGDVYFAYRSSEKSESGLYRYEFAKKSFSVVKGTEGQDIYGVAINQEPTKLF